MGLILGNVVNINVGIDDGLDDGKDDGNNECSIDGKVDGPSLEDDDGIDVCSNVGIMEGVFVTILVGSRDNISVGKADFSTVGIFEDTLVG